MYFPKNFLPNVINLKLTLCQGPGAASLLEAVELTVQNLQILDCYSRFVIPSSISLPNIRELCIKTQQRIRSLEINLSRVGKSLEKLELKGGVDNLQEYDNLFCRQKDREIYKKEHEILSDFNFFPYNW